MKFFLFLCLLGLALVSLLEFISCDTLTDTCKKLSDSDPKNLSTEFCVTTLQVNPDSMTADLHGLGVISLNLAIANATYVKSQFQKVLDEQKKPGGNIELSKSCEVCVEAYSLGLSSLNDAVSSFESKLYYDSNIAMSAVYDSPGTCEDTFKELKLTSPLAKENSNFLQLCAIPLAITHDLSQPAN
ncbi:hypothetical protein AQUCO_00300830v1 [Aquilegia coerulea]|uniref:Pectinesterase inhibitor domain-containing protein n=1 Tax=Aquilegia coerulea TaxID=218851 RepID=A0A2G5F113_AQUCA|nr:hypothetical protein AQUCO_00300830v1 [Aquilegia coerulea]